LDDCGGARLKSVRAPREAGISREHVRRLEAGLSDPTVGMLTKLARAFGVTLVDLVK
jgi:transcriptional regulator with XRE-family HTH domain